MSCYVHVCEGEYECECCVALTTNIFSKSNTDGENLHLLRLSVYKIRRLYM